MWTRGPVQRSQGSLKRGNRFKSQFRMVPQDFAKSPNTGTDIDGRLKVATAHLFVMWCDFHIAEAGARQNFTKAVGVRD